MRRPCIEGPNIFPVKPEDERPIVLVPAISITGERVLLQCRFPAITSHPWSDKPILPEIKVMEGRYTPGRELARDPYKTLPIEEGA